ncbi:amidase [Marinitenerispora sediminis]|uniref:Amidase n=1 Tax=Marinitenerispora sediminis TaxID=1931232 RepID=A0A368T593_9ACTN|nr:amidase [Marinitenerispora sediminis]RCV54657.1 amidase [Marinitenerispora sediminis]RCV56415.1 amidase [Marinitenerispora sediminis]RCV58616.1 amidase [Marinitenerispora sediminis]
MYEDIAFRPAREMAAMLRRREISARELVEAHLARIATINPTVNAVVTLSAERALREAHAADERLASGAPVGPLHGLPMAHKDTHDTAGIRTTYGSPFFTGNIPERDELLIERLRAAGAITIGKTNVPEFAAGSHTFNPVFGTTLNPYDVTRSAGGSSGGAAAALATGMHALADGSDMGGSLRNPASFNNVVGLRPSPGRVPVYPASLGWSTLSVQGPLARDAADAALLLSVMAGPDPRSPVALAEPGSEFAPPLDRDLAGLRVAWTPDLDGAFHCAQEVLDVLTPAVRVFEELGCRVTEAAPDLAGAEEVFRTLRAWTFESAYGPLLDADRDLLKPSLAWNIEEGRKLAGSDVARAERLRTEIYHRMREFFQDHDVLLLPVSQVPPFDARLEFPTDIDGVPQATYLDWMRSAYYISVTGSPALSVPAGFTPGGLPVGLQIVGPHHADRLVLEVGHAFERTTGFGQRRPPVA